MTVAVAVADKTTSGETTNAFSLEFLTERVTVREVIRARVYQEVTEYNARQSGLFRGLVQPADAAPGGTPTERKRIDWQAQYRQALKGFQASGFLLLIDDRQLTDLDEEAELRVDSRVTFLKLVPLMGG